MRILVIGRDGQVARSLAERGTGHELVFAGRPTVDLADPRSIERVVADAAPELVVNAGAYTAVDKAEAEPALAMAVNGDGPGILAAAAARAGAPIIHFSTDYVFDGASARPYREDDPVGPIGAYGASKLAGETAIRASGAHYAILRTAWVFSPFGANFAKTMLRLAADRDEVRVVDDQFGCPSSALDLADAVLAVADRWAEDPTHGIDQIYHVAGSGTTNWADFARAIYAASRARGGATAAVTGIPTSDYPTPARRPANSRLDCTRFETSFGFRMPDWQTSTEAVVARLVAV